MATFKLLLGFGVFVAIIVLGIKVVPPCFANYEFEDTLKADAVQATYSTRSEEDIRNTVIKHAHDYDIALAPQQVKVSRTGGFGTGTLNIEAEYSVPIDLPGYSTTISFHPSSSNKGVY
ncbi:MAG: hypothetical protein ABSG70_04370 [Terriglobales bacterium]|jgi:hypothetical protein